MEATLKDPNLVRVRFIFPQGPPWPSPRDPGPDYTIMHAPPPSGDEIIIQYVRRRVKKVVWSVDRDTSFRPWKAAVHLSEPLEQEPSTP